jgi:hypothetical protein
MATSAVDRLLEPDESISNSIHDERVRSLTLGHTAS